MLFRSKLLTSYDWPGNVRELENIIELMLNTRRFPELGKTKNNESDIELPDVEKAKSSLSYVTVNRLEDLEAMHIKRILEETAFNVSIAAKSLGIGRNTLYRKMNQYDIREV